MRRAGIMSFASFTLAMALVAPAYAGGPDESSPANCGGAEPIVVANRGSGPFSYIGAVDQARNPQPSVPPRYHIVRLPENFEPLPVLSSTGLIGGTLHDSNGTPYAAFYRVNGNAVTNIFTSKNPMVLTDFRDNVAVGLAIVDKRGNVRGMKFNPSTGGMFPMPMGEIPGAINKSGTIASTMMIPINNGIDGAFYRIVRTTDNGRTTTREMLHSKIAFSNDDQGLAEGQPVAINENGDTLAYTFDFTIEAAIGPKPVLWHADNSVYVFGSESYPNALNNHIVVGSDGARAVEWPIGSDVEIDLNLGNDSVALGINNNDQIVGIAKGGTFIYQNGQPAVLTPMTAGLALSETVSSARAISDSGMILVLTSTPYQVKIGHDTITVDVSTYGVLNPLQ